MSDPTPSPSFPYLRLRESVAALIDLPWELPLADWPLDERFVELPVGPSRHVTRFVSVEGVLFALKEEPLDVAQREYDVLRHCESVGLPAVKALGLAEATERSTAVLVTRYLEHSLQYRRLLIRLRGGPGPYRDRLLDGMAWLLVDLHRGGVFWGDCSLANTLFRRDGDRIQAYLVDAETSEVHPTLTDGQRAHDLDILVENVAFGLADVAAAQGGEIDADDAIDAAESVRTRYTALWNELHEEPELRPQDRHSVRARIRRLNELGFAVDEIALVPEMPGVARLRVTLARRRYHARELERRTGIKALENQARLLLNDLHEYQAWLAWARGAPVSDEVGAERWLEDVLRPTLDRLAPAARPRDLLQAYCDVLEHKWLLSEQAGRDLGLQDAIESYLRVGAPAPEVVSEEFASDEEAAATG